MKKILMIMMVVGGLVSGECAQGAKFCLGAFVFGKKEICVGGKEKVEITNITDKVIDLYIPSAFKGRPAEEVKLKPKASHLYEGEGGEPVHITCFGKRGFGRLNCKKSVTLKPIK